MRFPCHKGEGLGVGVVVIAPGNVRERAFGICRFFPLRPQARPHHGQRNGQITAS